MELHVHVNTTTESNLDAVEQFYALMEQAFSSLNLTLVSNSSSLLHSEPTKLEITVTRTTATATSTSIATSTTSEVGQTLIGNTEKTASTDFLIVVIAIGAILAACCCARAFFYARNRKRRTDNEELEDVPQNDIESGE